MYGIALYSIEETAQDNWQQNLFGNKVTINDNECEIDFIGT